MSENCNNAKHPLLRDGTSQLRRLLKALLPSYVAVDERSMDDLIAFARRYAEEIFYYDTNNLKNGNWVDFFNHAIDAQGSKTEPHYALFAAFLDLFRVAQDDLNTITARHLDFYYREVLQLREKPAVPDQVFMVFELAKNTFTHLLEKDTLLNAGKDGIGKNLDYALDENIVINKASVKEIKAVFADKTNQYRIFGSPVANSADGIGGEFENDELRWRTFGRPGSPADRPQSDIGLAISSPVLRLAEGQRTITITLNFIPPVVPVNSTLLAGAFRVLLSGEKEWIEAGQTSSTPSVGAGSISITRVLSRAQAAVIDYNAEKLGPAFDSPWPVMKLLLNNDLSSYAYSVLKDLQLTSVNVSVSVSGVKNLTLFSDSSKLKADKPFEPFTSRPVIGSSFYVGSAEVFSKQLSSLTLTFSWAGLPVTSFETYYNRYLHNNANRTNTGFKANISILDGKVWKPLKKEQLFNSSLEVLVPDQTVMINVNSLSVDLSSVAANTFQNRSLDPSANTLSSVSFVQVALSNYPPRGGYRPSNLRYMFIDTYSTVLGQIPRDPELVSVKELDANTFKGFVRLDLADADFGHKDYPVSLTAQLVSGEPYVVNPPYTPTVKELSLDYSSSVQISLTSTSEADFNGRVDRVYHIQPFGNREVHPFLFRQQEIMRMLPQFTDEGNLYIGLADLKPAQVVNILFRVTDGSADPDQEKQIVHWSYLSGNQWIEFPRLKIISDGTNGLLSSGIISFDVPSNATNDNTILTSGLHWLRATVTDFSGAVCDLTDVQAQAMTATFLDKENDPEHLRLPLPAETISKLRESDSKIKKVMQPYASFGGKVKETSNDFYMRVSERLRHKNRAVTIWDYEHLVLEQFPSVYKIKCISHTEDKPGNYSEVAPGHVTLITISNLRNKNVVNPLQPKTSLTLLEEIKDFILKRTSCWVDLDVRNPLFEEIRVNFKVRFRAGFDIGFYSQKLNEDIRRFLSPWAYDPGQDIVFGGKIYKSMILNFVEERDYVDYVTCFTMDHFTASGNFYNVDEAAGQTAASILVSAQSHSVDALETEDCECNDNIQTEKILSADDVSCDDTGTPDPEQGIGNDVIGDDFIVGYVRPLSGVGYFEIEKDFFVE